MSVAAALEAGQIAAEDLAPVLRHRCRLLERRVRRARRTGWDINAVAQIREELGPLVHGLHALGRSPAVDTALLLAESLARPLEKQDLPDPILGARFSALLETLIDQLPAGGHDELERSLVMLPHPPRGEALPLGFWRRWVADAAPPRCVPAMPMNRPPIPTSGTRPPPADASTLESPRFGNGSLPMTALRLYLLSDESREAETLAEQLRSRQFEVDVLSDIDELVELMGALPADVVLVDRMHAASIERIGNAMKPIRMRANQPIRMALITDTDDVMARLSARRAGMDAVLVRPHGGIDVANRLRDLFSTGEPVYRVLIVEDDRAQALFAEGVLRNAGMDTRIVLDALDVLPTLDTFEPDLILMDFHMPVANGIELTALIREREAFMHTPIVFLTGEQDEEVRFNAIDAGGDDFLAKPIRPKHLIASVQGRIRRYRDVQQIRDRESDGAAAVASSVDSGIVERGRMMARIDQLITEGRARGGVVFLEMETIAKLRERLGLGQFERLHVEALDLLKPLAGERMLCRFADGGFLVLDASLDPDELLMLGVQLREALVAHEFRLGDQSVITPAVAGVAPLAEEFTDAGALLNAVEKTAHNARKRPDRIDLYRPLAAEEALRQKALIDDMREAMSDGRLSLLYQPIVAVAGGEASRYQALLRLDTSSGKRMTAAEVIPAAERSGFIVEIDRWVLRESIAKIAKARERGAAMTLFVTQSPYTLAHGGHAEWLRNELRALDVPGGSLVLEMRLSDASVHTGTLREFCSAMVADGVQFCLSQFEPGPEVESTMEQLPLSLIKLAGKYSTGAPSSAVRDELKVIIDRAHRRSLEVIGHGVEDPQAAATLWMSGVDFVQGNLVQQAADALDFDFNQAIL
ncbi:EAL domain-containing protein [Silanimonas sp.]|uniref:EAL domain-containing protein n=1 Tax=Silanimonas sp. TaxID=1929290 RepID=UPI0022C259F2|nr:EAL domain-containing protein [Silanimonas sp.]MCZ8063941.1 EAL domain-containing protein [Silanimonas sp.]